MCLSHVTANLEMFVLQEPVIGSCEASYIVVLESYRLIALKLSESRDR